MTTAEDAESHERPGADFCVSIRHEAARRCSGCASVACSHNGIICGYMEHEKMRRIFWAFISGIMVGVAVTIALSSSQSPAVSGSTMDAAGGISMRDTTGKPPGSNNGTAADQDGARTYGTGNSPSYGAGNK